MLKETPIPVEELRTEGKTTSPKHSVPGAVIWRAVGVLSVVLAISLLLGLWAGYRRIDLEQLRNSETARVVFFELRLPRVLMAAVIGASLAAAGAALQALFRNPLADPFTLGVSGGAAVGASLALAAGWGIRISGVPLLFIAAFAGAGAAVAVVYRIARTGRVILPGSLLLAGVVVNLIAFAAVLTIQYMADPNRSLQILRWLVGSLDVVGFGTVWRMLVPLVPAWILLIALSRELQLLAMDEETAASLGVDVRRAERIVYGICCLIVGVTVSVGGTIGFVGLIVPHAVRRLFGEDVRIVLPCSFLLGAAFLVLADAGARSVLGSAELPVGAVTGLLGGPLFLWLLRREQRYSAF